MPKASQWRTYEQGGRVQTFFRLPGTIAAPRRIQRRLVSFSESLAVAAAPGPFFQMMCIGKLEFAPMRDGLSPAELFYRSPAW